jgi:hypothetical protein
MSDQLPNNEPFDRQEARRQRREERWAARSDPSRSSTWITGLILIILGAAFLLRNTGSFEFPLKNWWALFILIPAVGALDTALRMYHHAGDQLTSSAMGSLLVGLVLSFLTLSFLFELNMSLFGPILIILAGIGIVAVATIRRN